MWYNFMTQIRGGICIDAGRECWKQRINFKMFKAEKCKLYESSRLLRNSSISRLHTDLPIRFVWPTMYVCEWFEVEY